MATTTTPPAAARARTVPSLRRSPPPPQPPAGRPGSNGGRSTRPRGHPGSSCRGSTCARATGSISPACREIPGEGVQTDHQLGWPRRWPTLRGKVAGATPRHEITSRRSFRRKPPGRCRAATPRAARTSPPIARAALRGPAVPGRRNAARSGGRPAPSPARPSSHRDRCRPPRSALPPAGSGHARASGNSPVAPRSDRPARGQPAAHRATPARRAGSSAVPPAHRPMPGGRVGRAVPACRHRRPTRGRSPAVPRRLPRTQDAASRQAAISEARGVVLLHALAITAWRAAGKPPSASGYGLDRGWAAAYRPRYYRELWL